MSLAMLQFRAGHTNLTANGQTREEAISAGMGEGFDAGIEFAGNVGGGGKESGRGTIRE